MVVKTYRGLLTDDGQEKIALTTKDGSVGYRIVKFELIAALPGNQSQESVMKIYKTEQSTIDGIVNFTDNDLLGVAYYRDNNNEIYPASLNIIFDNEIFNQDIYITHKDIAVGQECNYFLELEQMKLDQTQNMSATLKAIRGSAVD